MDFDKIMKWMELAKMQQTSDFWNAFADQSSFNQFMKENGNMGSSSEPEVKKTPQNKFPPIDIYMTETDIIILADLAGYLKENLQVSISGAKLLIKGTMAAFISGQPILQERIGGEFQRVVDLPEPTDISQIRAKFENGLLIVSYRRIFGQEEHVNIE